MASPASSSVISGGSARLADSQMATAWIAWFEPAAAGGRVMCRVARELRRRVDLPATASRDDDYFVRDQRQLLLLMLPLLMMMIVMLQRLLASLL